MSEHENDFPHKGNGIEETHPIFSHDPSEWLNILHSQVNVTTKDGKQHCGWVYTVDPVSESIVLIDYPDDNVDILSSVAMEIVIGSSIASIDSVSPKSSERVKTFCDHLFRPKSSLSLSQEELLIRRTKLQSWLEKHLLPVKIGGQDGQSLVVAGALVIQSPFSEDSCLSTNEIILSKIQGLIKTMPADQSTW